MSYAATASKNSGPTDGSVAANFGACPIETSGVVNAGSLKLAGTAVTVVAGIAGTAITQTYSTATTTVPNVTTSSPSTTLVLTATNIAAKTASLTLIDVDASSSATIADTMSQNLKDIGTAFNTLRVEVAAAVADILANRKLINQIIDDLQVAGIET